MNLPSFVPTLFPVFYVEDTVQFIRQFLAKLKEEDTTKWEKILEMIEKELTSPFPINTSFLVKLESYEKSMKNDVQVGGEEK
ncbi:hypothetical protein Q73_05110 [Bacillus coahuilensis m2-6]|uniref:hypothetical protein n=1 Tax=Bacillus coahuilensis TaxID=408580 RepID=UPI0001850C20|nr:hypothetical protein [Bacillus coahuilensis]KUP08571.1 hypothetical protein Q73_05110 [Bacillus coahuilensis m2-6]